MNSKTRLKITLIAGFLLSAMAILAIALHMETVATTSIAGIMTILTAFIWAQTKRPSNYDSLPTNNSNTDSSANSSTRNESMDQSDSGKQ